MFKLAQLVGLAPQDAHRALKLADGDIEKAICAELLKLQLNEYGLKPMIQEYFNYRALIGGDSSAFMLESNDVAKLEVEKRRHIAQEVASIRDRMASFSLRNNANARKELEEIQSQLNALIPNFFAKFVLLGFALKRLEFVACLRGKDYAGAVELARHLSTISSSYPQSELQKAFRETTLYLAYPDKIITSPHTETSDDNVFNHPNTEPVVPVLRFSTSKELAQEIYFVLNKFFEISEPKLVQLLKCLLSVHGRWFLQEGLDDPFLHLFHLDDLRCSVQRNTYSFGFGQSMKPSESDIDALEEQLLFDPEDMIKTEKGSFIFEMHTFIHTENIAAKEMNISDEDVISLREILCCSRFEALKLLLEHQGNLMEVIEKVL